MSIRLRVCERWKSQWSKRKKKERKRTARGQEWDWAMRVENRSFSATTVRIRTFEVLPVEACGQAATFWRIEEK